MSNREIKKTLRRLIKEKGLKITALSSMSGEKFLSLACIMYYPFAKIKLFQTVHICKALGVSLYQII